MSARSAPSAAPTRKMELMVLKMLVEVEKVVRNQGSTSMPEKTPLSNPKSRKPDEDVAVMR